MELELFEQLGWRVPDVILYPTGGGVGLIGIFKALQECQELGWIGPKLPRLVAVQASGCAPIVKRGRRGPNNPRHGRTPAPSLLGSRSPSRWETSRSSRPCTGPGAVPWPLPTPRSWIGGPMSGTRHPKPVGLGVPIRLNWPGTLAADLDVVNCQQRAPGSR